MRKKVLYFLSSDHNYGAPKSLMELVLYLNKNYDVDPIVITCTRGKVNDFCDQNGFLNYVVPYKEFMIVGGSNRLRRIVKRMLLPYYYFRYKILKSKAIKKIENIINFHEIDLIHTNINRVNIGLYFSLKYHIPHIWHIREFGQEDYNCVSLEKNYIDKMNQSNSTFVSISQAVLDSWVKKGLRQDKIRVIYNGIDNSKIIPSTFKRIKEDKIKIIFAGLLSETKGQIQLIQALGELSSESRKKIQVDFYGSGRNKYIEFLKSKVHALDIEECVHFCGYSSNLYELYKDYDIGVVCSRSEGFGRVTAEYMLAGLCVIASDTGANQELIDDHKTGFIYHYGDSKSLSEVLLKILNNEVDLEKIKKNAFSKATDNYTMEICSRNVDQLYNEVVSEK